MVLQYKKFDLFGKKVFEIAKIQPPFKNFNQKQHQACYLYIYEGANDSYSEEEYLRVEEGDGVLMKCGNYFYDLKKSEKTGLSGVISVHFYPEVLKRIYKDNIPSFLKNDAGMITHKNMTLVKSDILIKRFMEDMRFYFANPELMTNDLLLIRLKEIILLLLQSKDADMIHKIMHNLFSPREVSFRSTIEAHLFSPISIVELAQLTNHSLASFKREFKRIFNDSPANYIKNKRLEKAADLLRLSDLSVSDIAFECLFNDLAHFSASFKIKYKMSPKSFRKSQLYKSLS